MITVIDMQGVAEAASVAFASELGGGGGGVAMTTEMGRGWSRFAVNSLK